MAIIISKNGKDAEKINQSIFVLEDKLQDYIYKNPDAIPLYDIDEDIRLFIAAREFSTRSGPIDALGFDSRGNIYVVETKLYKNPDKRQVVAQALDYGASLWRHATGFDDFVRRLDAHCQKEFGSNFTEKYADFFDLDDASESIDRIKENLSDGVIKFVVLMDSLHSALKDLVIYVNQNSKFDIYAVELEYYKHNEFEIVIPKIFGAEVKKDVSTRNDSKKFDNQKILDWIDEINSPYLHVDQASTTKTYIRFITDFMEEIVPSRNDASSSWKSGTAYYYEIIAYQSGVVKIQLALNSQAVDQAQAEGQKKIIEFSDRNPQKPDWLWFVAASWKVDHQSGEATLRSDIRRIITEEIPNFENKLKNYISNLVQKV